MDQGTKKSDSDDLNIKESMTVKSNPDGTISVNGKTFASMEDFAGYWREREEKIKGDSEK